MGSFLERGDAVFWEKKAIRMQRFLSKLDIYFCERNLKSKNNKQLNSIYKEIRHFRKLFCEK